MEANCGPSNAMTKLSQHSQRDNSLQNEFITRNQQAHGPQNFKSGHQVDMRLNQEFNQFNTGNNFATSFMNSPNFQPPQLQRQQQHQHNQFHQQSGNASWVQDFSGLSIQGNPQAQQAQPAQQNDWNQQFMHANQQQDHQHNQRQFDVGQQFVGAPTTSFNLNMRTNLSTPLNPQFSQNKQFEQSNFDEQFDLIEKELESQISQQTPQEHAVEDISVALDSEKDEFAKTAQEVERSMRESQTVNADMKEKIEKSQFLKLMNSIGSRQVELEGEKLVDRVSGQDVRDMPESSSTRATPGSTSSVSMNQAHGQAADLRQAESVRPVPKQDQINRLPDPLAHINDGELADVNEPLLAARIVSGNQVRSGDWMEDFDSWGQSVTNARAQRSKNSILSDEWQEVFDDYRHDDDDH